MNGNGSGDHQNQPPKLQLPESQRDLFDFVSQVTSSYLPPGFQSILLGTISAFYRRQERNWQESKEEAIRAVSAGFAERLNSMRDELTARDATVSSISQYFEELVADLTEKTRRDPKTQLLNYTRFIELLEAFLILEQGFPYCAVGLVDVVGFKWYNDNLGHAVGDMILDKVADLLRKLVRLDSTIALVENRHGDRRSLGSVPAEEDERRRAERRQAPFHARFGGDEYCFLIPDLERPQDAAIIAERFRDGVARFDWASLEPRLADNPVKVSVGVVCLSLGPVHERRSLVRKLADGLIRLADQLMYTAKGEQSNRVHTSNVCITRDELVELVDSGDIEV